MATKPTPPGAERTAISERRARRKANGLMVRKAISESGIKQRRVADALGIHESALSRALRGDRGFEPSEMEILRTLLGSHLKDTQNQESISIPAVLEARRGFARRLRARREELNWSPDRARMGICDLEAYMELEEAARPPEVYELMRLPGQIGVSLRWLVHGIPYDDDPSYS